MPMPFHCHECDKPTNNKSGICDSCEQQLYNVDLRVKHPRKEAAVYGYFEGTRIPKSKEIDESMDTPEVD